MNITATKLDSANASIKAKIDKSDIEKYINKIAKDIAKTANIDGFRKGKVPVGIIKKLYKDRLNQDAQSEAITKIIAKAKDELNIKDEDIIGEPIFDKFETNDDGSIDLEITISLKPTINIGEYKDLAPSYEEPEVSEDEIQERLDKLLEQNSKFKKLKESRPLKNGDQAKFDFVGKIDGEEFEGGKAEGFELEIGSGQFINGFEEQMIGMNEGETKDINVTFPENYQAKELAGKKAVFTITLHEIKEKEKPELDDEMVKKLIPGNENATADTVKERIKEQIKSEKIAKIYNDELKPKLMEILIEKYEFDLPKNIVEQEVDEQVNQKAKSMSKEELDSYKDNKEKIEELRESLREDAEKSVKATFLVDALAKKENISVTDNEVTQTIYYEAIMNNQNPEEILKFYKENNLLPAIKMGIIEDKLFTKILGLDK